MGETVLSHIRTGELLHFLMCIFDEITTCIWEDLMH